MQKQAKRVRAQQQEFLERHRAFLPLVEYFRKQKFTEKQSVMYQDRVIYFRSDDFADFVIQHKEKIQELVQPGFTFENKDDQRDIYKFVEYLMENKVVVRLERDEDDAKASAKKLKYPKRLVVSKDQTPGNKQLEKGFFTFTVKDKNQSSTRLRMTILLAAVVIICLFPIWPIIVKRGIFYVSLYFLIIVCGFYFLRFVVFVFFRVLGLEVWLFPDIDSEEHSFLQSFKRVISVDRCHDDIYTIIFRIVGFVVIGFACYMLYTDGEYIENLFKFINSSYDDIIEWGNKKIEGVPPNALASNPYPRYEDLVKDEPLETDIGADAGSAADDNQY